MFYRLNVCHEMLEEDVAVFVQICIYWKLNVTVIYFKGSCPILLKIYKITEYFH